MSELSALKMSKNLPNWYFQTVRIICFKNVQEFANLVCIFKMSDLSPLKCLKILAKNLIRIEKIIQK